MISHTNFAIYTVSSSAYTHGTPLHSAPDIQRVKTGETKSMESKNLVFLSEANVSTSHYIHNQLSYRYMIYYTYICPSLANAWKGVYLLFMLLTDAFLYFPFCVTDNYSL